MQRIERADGRLSVMNEIRYLDPDVERRRIALGEIELELTVAQEQVRRDEQNEKIAKWAVYVGLAVFCTAFWAGIIWWAER